MRILTILFIGTMCLALTGCMESGTEKGATMGAVGGGVIGGVVGHQSGRTAEGVAIGAVTGAILGGLIGHETDKSQGAQPARVIAICPGGHQVDVTGFAPGTRVRCPICNAEFNI